VPLFLPARRFQDGDMLVVSNNDRLSMGNSKLIIYLAVYCKTPRGLTPSAFVHYYYGTLVSGTTARFADLKAKTGFNPRMALDVDRVEGRVNGKLDLDDPYEVRSYMKRAYQLIWPKYIDELRAHRISIISTD